MGAGQRDRITLRGMRFYAYHGANPEEQVLGQRFEVDVELQTDLRKAGRTDDIADTINYSTVYKRVNAIISRQPRKLIEAVAHEIAVELLREFSPEVVEVTVKKIEAPLKDAMLESVGVSVVRTIGDLND
ncbi:MAG: dihydroneopterin aldolase [Thermomicrobiales bacterium]